MSTYSPPRKVRGILRENSVRTGLIGCRRATVCRPDWFAQQLTAFTGFQSSVKECANGSDWVYARRNLRNSRLSLKGNDVQEHLQRRNI